MRRCYRVSICLMDKAGFSLCLHLFTLSFLSLLKDPLLRSKLNSYSFALHMAKITLLVLTNSCIIGLQIPSKKRGLGVFRGFSVPS